MTDLIDLFHHYTFNVAKGDKNVLLRVKEINGKHFLIYGVGGFGGCSWKTVVDINDFTETELKRNSQAVICRIAHNYEIADVQKKALAIYKKFKEKEDKSNTVLRCEYLSQDMLNKYLIECENRTT